jgi:hypothetical protein
LLLFFLTAPEPLHAQGSDQAVPRISFVSGPVSYSRGDDPDEWDDAMINVPFTLGDKLYSTRDGRAELQLPAGNFIRLAPQLFLSS